MTKTEALEKMNRRHGTDIGDFYIMLLWLRQSAERCERKSKGTGMYLEQAAEYRAEYRADYNELSKAE